MAPQILVDVGFVGRTFTFTVASSKPERIKFDTMIARFFEFHLNVQNSSGV